MGDRELNRSILRNNIIREEPGFNSQAVERAVDVAEIAFTGMTGNGRAAEIGIEVVKREIYKR